MLLSLPGREKGHREWTFRTQGMDIQDTGNGHSGHSKWTFRTQRMDIQESGSGVTRATNHFPICLDSCPSVVADEHQVIATSVLVLVHCQDSWHRRGARFPTCISGLFFFYSPLITCKFILVIQLILSKCLCSCSAALSRKPGTRNMQDNCMYKEK